MTGLKTCFGVAVLLFLVACSTNTVSTSVENASNTSRMLTLTVVPDHPLDDNAMVLSQHIIEQRFASIGYAVTDMRKSSDGKLTFTVDSEALSDWILVERILSNTTFEARILGKTVFSNDAGIVAVCTAPECSGLDPSIGCGQVANGDVESWVCRFRFLVNLSENASNQIAEATSNMSLMENSSGAYLDEPMILYLNGKQIDTWLIEPGLKGKPVTTVQLSGAGYGDSAWTARNQTLAEMKLLQVSLVTQSLPATFSRELRID